MSGIPCQVLITPRYVTLASAFALGALGQHHYNERRGDRHFPSLFAESWEAS